MTAQHVGGGVLSISASAAEAKADASKANIGPMIRRIDVEGNQRIERETVLSYMSFREGMLYDPSQIEASLQSLFATGLFADIGLRRDGDTLIVSVVETPLINPVAYEGNSAQKDKELNNKDQPH